MAGQLTIDTLKASSGVLATQNGMTGIAKAWVLFAGSTSTIASSFNVSSVTKNSTGNFTLNFTTALSSANHSSMGTAGNGAGGGGALFSNFSSAPATTTLNVATYTVGSPAATDFAYTSVSVFGA